MYTLGIDIGSASSKGAILKNGSEITAKLVIPLGTGTGAAEQLYLKLLESSGLSKSDITHTIATGYGRMKFSKAEEQISELSCHAAGVHFLIPSAKTVIDIGGQDAKAMRIGPNGKLQNFVMNDKCAAGTGRFLDVMSKVLNVNINDMGTLSVSSDKDVSISSTCTVFAESEVISQLSAGEKIEDIIAGIHTSVARRVGSMAMRIGCEPDIVMSGGVALNNGVVRAMAKELNSEVKVHPDCQLAGAIGAAYLAWERCTADQKQR